VSRRSKRHHSPFVIILLFATSIIVGGLATPAAAASRKAQAPNASSKSEDILFIHGVDSTSSGADGNDEFGNCGNSFQPAISLLTDANHQWGGHLITLSYYTHDHNCSPNGNIRNTADGSRCNGPNTGPTGFYDSGDNDGTNNEDDRHLACLLAWYIWDNYTINGQTVNVVAHSLGGVLLKEALYEVYVQHLTVTHNPAGPFPDHLYLDHVVTLSSPLGGLLKGSAYFDCKCTQLAEIEDGGAIIGDLTSPEGENLSSRANAWTMEGQVQANDPSGNQVGPNCDPVGESAFGMSSGIKIDYSYPVNNINTVPQAQPCNDLGTNDWYYFHGDYLYDNQIADDVTVNYCSGCVYDPPAMSRNFHHSLIAIYFGLVTNYPVVDVVGGGAFLDKWKQMGGLSGVLGAPTGNWHSIASGQAQDFQGGSIYWSSATGTYEVQGAIHSSYVQGWGGPAGGLGFPTSDEQGIANGRVSYFYGNLCGTDPRGPHNSGSAIYYSSTTDAHQVGGCIYNKYWNLGEANSALNFPTTDVKGISGGYVSYFYGALCGSGARGPNNSGSAIYYSGATGAHFVWGCIYTKYWSMHETSSALGYPSSDELAIGAGHVSYFYGNLCSAGSRGPNNSGGAIYDTGSTGAHFVWGCIYYTYWHDLSGPTGLLGFPVSDETTIHDSSGNLLGWASYFQGSGCGIGPWQSPGNPYGSSSAIYVPGGGGGHEVHGCILATYVQGWGGPTGPLGWPITNEYTNSAGDRESDFQNGAIIWHNSQALVIINNPGCGAQTAC